MLKRNLKAKICRLCLSAKCDKDFKVVEVIKEVLEIVLPKLNLAEGDEHLLCSSCSAKLFAAFNFKSVCTDTEDIIFPYINSQEIPLINLREIYLKEKGDIKSIDILENQKICRLCFQTARYGFVSLNEVDADIIDNYIPEVNFNATKDPVICKVCSDSLLTHGTFLSSCLAAQEENRKVCGDPAEDGECCIKTEKIKTEDDWERKVCDDPAEDKECCIKTEGFKLEDDCERYENVCGSPTEDRECCIKTEEIKIEDDCESYPPTSLENVETIKNVDGRFSSENIPVEYKQCLIGKVQTYMCNRCDFKTVHKYSIKRHCWRHVSLTTTYFSESRDASSPCPLRDQVRMFQCEKCPYKVRRRQAFVNHWSTHELPPEVKVYQCEKCHFRVTQKNHFLRHQRSHEDGGKVQIYTCDKCDFQTRYRSNLLTHQLLHKTKKWKDLKCYTGDDGQLMYKCDGCKYETKTRRQLLVHRCHQMSPTKQQKLKCRVCAYEADNKTQLMTHQVKHNSKLKPYKCKVCSYETIWMRNFKRHQLCHKKKCEVKPYGCFKCSFRTKYKNSLKMHVLRHGALE